ncbi:MAG: imidazoleglycerol-phosphate dehydratase HisB [Clostridiales bacterium]|nr:imidazoleglycerol-phosphate dehydratase HisB [Clostridiales bacterium]
MRKSSIKRVTSETDIAVDINLDGAGVHNIDTGIGFLDHMLILLTSHGRFDININCKGDTFIDSHHTTEDIGIVLGQAFKEALGNKMGINRYATITLPMDESLAMISIDISGRPYLHYSVKGLPEKLGDMDSQSFEEFFRGFTNSLRATVHVNLLYGRNGHHMIECIFKALGRALSIAVAKSGIDEIPSTKGLLD